LTLLAKHPQAPDGEVWEFGPFRLSATRRQLLRDGEQVRLGSRAFDILLTLVKAEGDLVSQAELAEAVWPNLFVEPSTLRVHLAAVRKALATADGGPSYVANVSGRGYRFVVPISQGGRAAGAPERPPAGWPMTPSARMIGRDALVESLVELLPRQRLLTLLGPGGIGKTTVALAVAEQFALACGDGAKFVDLSPLTAGQRISKSVAAALGQQVLSEDPSGLVVAHLQPLEMLLVLDNCEHVIDDAALLAEAILQSAPGVHILATSREPLRAEGEWVHRLRSLSAPGYAETMTPAEALAYPAVELFVARAAASVDGFVLAPSDVAAVAEICRRLDGIPLAIELAAVRVDMFGVRGLADRLDDRHNLLLSGRRTAIPRHRTLAATLDWSHDLLGAADQSILRRLAVFRGAFTEAAALAVAMEAGLTQEDVYAGLANLVAKSMLSTDPAGPHVCFRLLDTTRAYAHARLEASGELPRVERRHAQYHRELFERLRTDWQAQDAPQRMAQYGRQIDDVRAALDWALGRGDAPDIGVPLCLAAIPLLWSKALIEECGAWIERALASLGPEHDRRAEMELLVEFFAARLQIQGSGPRMADAARRALSVAEAIGDRDYRLRAHWCLMVNAYSAGDFELALTYARDFSRLADEAPESPDAAIGDRVIANVLHVLGDQAAARSLVERSLARYRPPNDRSHLIKYRYEQRVVSLCTLAQIQWLQGFAEQALHTALAALAEGEASNHLTSLYYALVHGACPIAIAVGDLDTAERCVAKLVIHSGPPALQSAWGPCFSAMIAIRRGAIEAGVPALRQGLAQSVEASLGPRYNRVHGELADVLLRTGRKDEADALLERLSLRSAAKADHWCDAEIMRLKGDSLILEGDFSGAETRFSEARDIAQSQGALAWELRAATSLARLRSQQGRPTEGRDLLAAVYSRFSEGHGSWDLVQARSLLVALGSPDLT